MSFLFLLLFCFISKSAQETLVLFVILVILVLLTLTVDWLKLNHFISYKISTNFRYPAPFVHITYSLFSRLMFFLFFSDILGKYPTDTEITWQQYSWIKAAGHNFLQPQTLHLSFGVFSPFSYFPSTKKGKNYIFKRKLLIFN